MRFGFNTLEVRIAAAVALAVLVAQAANVSIIAGERHLAMAFAQDSVAVVQFVEQARAPQRGPAEALHMTGTLGALQFFGVSDQSIAPRFAGGAPSPDLAALLVRRLQEAGIAVRPEEVSVRIYTTTAERLHDIILRSGVFSRLGIPPAAPESLDREAAPAESFRLTVLSARLPDGRWLNSLFRPPELGEQLHWRLVASTTLLMAIALTAALLLARRLARPLRELARECDALRVGADFKAVPERGSTDVRRMIAAFNALNGGRSQLIDMQRRMIGAIAHDLRTPLATLRLRAEKVTDAENKDRMIAVIDEARQTLDSVTAYVQDGVAPEEMRLVDVAALAESLSADYQEMGEDVVFVGEDLRCPARIRPAQVTRALRNLIENAVKYGARARVSVACEAAQISIRVDDDGPGVPEAELEAVFEPFVRLETSRNRETGGVGLGLPIARAIARSHGGDVGLAMRASGGATATLTIARAP